MGYYDATSHPLPDGREVEIRQLAANDAEPLLRALNSVIDEKVYLLLAPGELRMTREQEMEWIIGFTLGENNLYLVATVDGEIVGGASCRQESFERRRHLGTLGIFITRPWRERGIGGLVMNALIRWAREASSLEKLTLEVAADNNRAIRLYEKLGFRREGVRPQHLRLGENHYVDEVEMGLFLRE